MLLLGSSAYREYIKGKFIIFTYWLLISLNKKRRI